MSNIKVLKKGEFLFREGDKLTALYIIQSGSMNLCMVKGKKTVDVLTLGASQVMGEQGMLGANAHNLSAVAVTETKVLEVPLDQMKTAIESSNQLLKIFNRSMLDRVKLGMAEIRNSKNEKEASPCPDELTAQIFGGVFHTLNHKGDKDPKNPLARTIDWNLFKYYCFRVFGISAKRIENVIYMMMKMKNAEVEMGKPVDDPEGEDEIQSVKVYDISALEAFFEFWQYVYFKSGRSEYLKVDENLLNLLGQLVEFGKGREMDRFGVVRSTLTEAIQHLKDKAGLNITSDHFLRLENKGIFTKRHARTDGVLELQFELKEFVNMHKVWRMIREVDRWNEKGLVDPNEPEETPKKAEAAASGAASCPSCSESVPSAAKFCPACGFKLGGEAKAS